MSLPFSFFLYVSVNASLYHREAAQNVQSAVKEAAQGLNPRRPGAVGATATGGWNPATEIAADVNALIDALGKVGKVETPMSGNIPSM